MTNVESSTFNNYKREESSRIIKKEPSNENSHAGLLQKILLEEGTGSYEDMNFSDLN